MNRETQNEVERRESVQTHDNYYLVNEDGSLRHLGPAKSAAERISIETGVLVRHVVTQFDRINRTFDFVEAEVYHFENGRRITDSYGGVGRRLVDE